MTVLVTLEAEVKSEHVAELPALLEAVLPSTRAFEGCGTVKCYLSQDKRKLLLVEDWDSKEAQQKYLAWRLTTDHGKQLVAMFVAPPEIRYYDPLNL
jgi:quinol monooxygenase YgiN